MHPIQMPDNLMWCIHISCTWYISPVFPDVLPDTEQYKCREEFHRHLPSAHRYDDDDHDDNYDDKEENDDDDDDENNDDDDDVDDDDGNGDDGTGGGRR